MYFGIALTLCGVMSASVANIMQATKAAKNWPMIPMLGWAMLLGAAMLPLYQTYAADRTVL